MTSRALDERGNASRKRARWRDVVEPFTERQIELVKTFADQAVIAIENVRLFKEQSNGVRWSSKPRRAKSLGVIASSPTDIQPVLDVVAENAARLCERSRRANLSCRRQ